MGILDWFRRKRTRPIIADSEGKSPYEQAKEILSQNEGKEDLLSTKMKEATVKLDKFETAPVIKEVPKRARTKKGTYQADDKSTPDVNEAWTGGKAPVKKAKPKKKTVKVTRTKPKK
tara:strand:- start:2739 stop:3089 length:351 start_codon:yes stop_codon:yes gene_type:complete